MDPHKPPQLSDLAEPDISPTVYINQQIKNYQGGQLVDLSRSPGQQATSDQISDD